MSELTRKEKARAMRNGKMKMAKEGCVWTAEDDMILQGMFDDGEDNLDMALILERKEPAIQQRIDQLGCTTNKSAPGQRKRSLQIPLGAYVASVHWTGPYVPTASITTKTRRKHNV